MDAAQQGAGARRGTATRFARQRAPRLSPKALGRLEGPELSSMMEKEVLRWVSVQ